MYGIRFSCAYHVYQEYYRIVCFVSNHVSWYKSLKKCDILGVGSECTFGHYPRKN